MTKPSAASRSAKISSFSLSHLLLSIQTLLLLSALLDCVHSLTRVTQPSYMEGTCDNSANNKNIHHDNIISSSSSSPLTRARQLEVPPVTKSVRGETEGQEFWDEHEVLLREAREEYGPLHPQLYHLNEDFVANFFDIPLQNVLRSRSVAQLQSLVYPTEADNVFAFKLFNEKFVELLIEELEHYDRSGIPIRRPNGMNRYGFLLQQIGMQQMMTDLSRVILQPLALTLFPQNASLADVQENYPFVVRYHPNTDNNLRPHADASVITINVCLHPSSQEDSPLYFQGVRQIGTITNTDNNNNNNNNKETHGKDHHQGHIQKVMFLCAQARPRYDPETKSIWDGKLGIWPVEQDSHTHTQKTLKREPGEDPCRDGKLLTKDEYRQMLLNNVVDAVIQKWPRAEWNNPQLIIRIQQDGAKTQIHPTDKEFENKLKEKRVEDKILLCTQPPNSSDTNINDLGFFASLQPKYRCNDPNDVSDVIQLITKTYNDYDHKTINNIWLSLMSCYNMIIECNGGNEYEIPAHVGTETLEKNSSVIAVTKDAFQFF